MPDEKREQNQEQYSVDDILFEVSSWSWAEDEAEDTGTYDKIETVKPNESPTRPEKEAPPETSETKGTDETLKQEESRETENRDDDIARKQMEDQAIAEAVAGVQALLYEEDIIVEQIEEAVVKHTAETTEDAMPQEAEATDSRGEENVPFEGEVSPEPAIERADEVPKEEKGSEEAPSETEEEAREKPEGEAEEGAEVLREAEQEGESPEEAEKTKEKIEEEAPEDNLVHLYGQKEPETIREVLKIGYDRTKVWIRLRKDHFKIRKPKIDRNKFKLNWKKWLPKVAPLPVPEDRDPKELAQEYGEGLTTLRLQCAGALFCGLLLFVLALLHQSATLPTPPFLEDAVLSSWISLGLLVAVLLLCWPILKKGTQSILKKQIGMEFGALVASIAVLTDGLTMLLTPIRPVTLPLFAPCALVLGFQLWGLYWKRRAQRLSCRTAAAAAHPDLMTVEPGEWEGKDVYRRRAGRPYGFGSQVQQEDGAEQMFRLMMPILLIAATALSLLAILIRQQPGLIFWALSGTVIAACTLSGTLCFSLPYRGLSRRLSKLGVALAGWPAAQKAKEGGGILVEDSDLFPPGYIKLDSYEIFGSATDEMVLSVTASLLRESGSGLSGLFYNLIRVEVGRYVPVTELRIEDEGISGKVMGADVLVGNIDFLERMGIGIPGEVKETTGVVCAIGGEFAGQFILSYAMHRASEPAMDSLLSNHITPILIALDFNVVPSVMRKQFRIPWEAMSFPYMSERVELYHKPFPKDGSLLAVLTRQGLAAMSTAAVGAQRLHKAVKRCANFSFVAAVVGVLLTFYLSAAGALAALSAMSLTLFLLLWFFPLVLMSSWVNQIG